MRIYIISAYPAVRAGLAALMREQHGWQVMGEATPEAAAHAAVSPPSDALNVASALPRLAESAPDVVLADLDGVTDEEAMDALLPALRPRGGIVVVTPSYLTSSRGRVDPAALTLVSDMMRAAEESGVAFGALRRDATTEEIVAAITAVAGGLITLDRQIASGLLTTTTQLAPASATPLAGEEPLTARELEVLQLLAQGLPNKLIAQRLKISEHTAKFHVSAIMTKLGAASRTEAVTRAARRGLLLF